ncbi:MAG: hypothetical protein JKY42_01600 [Flavobacteriales bacterium]|nr:hypothetical protein [Flavobacteriales bacterium]
MDAGLILYVAPDCNECEEVIDYVNRNNFQLEIVNLETRKERLEKGIFIYPALCNNTNVLAYGTDILKYLI